MGSWSANLARGHCRPPNPAAQRSAPASTSKGFENLQLRSIKTTRTEMRLAFAFAYGPALTQVTAGRRRKHRRSAAIHPFDILVLHICASLAPVPYSYRAFCMGHLWDHTSQHQSIWQPERYTPPPAGQRKRVSNPRYRVRVATLIVQPCLACGLLTWRQRRCLFRKTLHITPVTHTVPTVCVRSKYLYNTIPTAAMP